MVALGGYTGALGLLEGCARSGRPRAAKHGIQVISFKTDGIPQRIPDNGPMKQTMSVL